MSSVDSIWADMKKESILSAPSTSRIGFVSEKECKSSIEKSKKKLKSKSKKDKQNRVKVSDNLLNTINTPINTLQPDSTEPTSEGDLFDGLTPEELISRLQRPIQQTQDEQLFVRKSALQLIHKILCIQLKDKLSDTAMNRLLEELSKPILKRFADQGAEKIRELAVEIMTFLISHARNLLGVLPYLYPVVMDRLGHSHGFDTETNIFVHDVEAHKAWKRGAAVARQDQAASGVEGVVVVKVLEPSEEIRLRLLKLMTTLMDVMISRNTTNLIHPYFHDTVLFIQAHLRDPYPEIKLEACRSLTALAREPSLNQGMVYYALAIARAALPVLRHRHAKVRVASIRLVASAIGVPYKAKCRGAGTDAVVDLIGYTAEDTIPVAAFYGEHRSVNYLAELTVDSVPSVRLECAKMLAEFITVLPDRYDHRTRLVPFLLNAVNDSEEKVCDVAMKALSIAGAEYEKENESDIIERRQYGVDGDRRAFHGDLPHPFKDRPRLGERLYVRGCTRRFLKPLLRELTDWKSKTKLSSAKLLRTVIVYTEEGLTQELHMMVPDLCSAFKSVDSDESDVFKVLSECCELLGRFIAPDSYVPFLLPRLKGELEVLPGGTDGSGRALVLLLGKLFMRGSAPKELVKHAEELTSALTDEVVLTSGLPQLKSRALDACGSLVRALVQSGASLEAHYLASGRLAHKAKLIKSLLYGLFVWRSDPTLKREANTTLALLATVEARDDASLKPFVEKFNKLRIDSPVSMCDEDRVVEEHLVKWIATKYADVLTSAALDEYPLDALWESTDSSHVVVSQLLELVESWAMIPLLQKMDVLFKVVPEEMELTFYSEWNSILAATSWRLMSLEEDTTGQVQHSLLCLYRRFSFSLGSIESRVNALCSFLSLCDKYSWREMRISDAKLCGSLLITQLSPVTPMSTRVETCRSLGEVLRMGYNGRLKPFQKMQTKQTVRTDWVEVACLVYKPLLNMLGDPMEAVRIEAAKSLQDILFFVSPQGTFSGSRESVDDGWSKVSISEIDGTIPSGMPDYINFSDMIKEVALLLAGEGGDWNVEEEEDAFLNMLDSLLRQAAVIDPRLFLDSLSDFSLTGRLGELESHCELLLNLERPHKTTLSPVTSDRGNVDMGLDLD